MPAKSSVANDYVSNALNMIEKKGTGATTTFKFCTVQISRNITIISIF
ncbi:MAG: hypothetical protein ACREBU_09075 [Nitrososphaera sp.]